MALDTATRTLVDAMAAKAVKPRHELTPDEARAALAGLRDVVGGGPQNLYVSNFSITVEGAAIRARLYAPESGELLQGMMVYFHGGGWVVGSIDVFERMCREIAVATGCALVAVEYRKAPEHAYPGPVDDAWTALQWVDARQQELLGTVAAGHRLPLLVGGDSAGANLAIATTLRARAQGSPAIAAQLLVYPVTDCGMDTASYLAPENQLMLTREVMASYWNHYARAERRGEEEASPLRASDLSGLPPAVILTAEHDVLRDEGEAYGQRLEAAGVHVMQHRLAGQMHGFLMMGDLLPGSAAGMQYIGRAVRQILQREKQS